jgi:hypothetical protein
MPRKKKETTKRPLRKKRKKVMACISEITDLYKIINKVQIQDVEQKCSVEDVALLPVIENVVRDSSLIMSKEKNEETGIIICTISPGEEKFGQNVSFDEYEKEILEMFEE